MSGRNTRVRRLLWALSRGASVLAMSASAHETQRKTELFKPGIGFAESGRPQQGGTGKPPLYEGLGGRSVPGAFDRPQPRGGCAPLHPRRRGLGGA